METKRNRYTVYNITNHLVGCPKYRRKLLTGLIRERLEELMRDQGIELDGEVIASEIQPDPVHPLAGFLPTLATRQMMHRIQEATRHALRRALPSLQGRLPLLWTCSYCAGTADNVSAERVRRIMGAQKGQ